MPKHIPESFQFFAKASTIPVAHWNQVVPATHIYLSLVYLRALEESLQGKLKPIYVLVYDSKKQPILAGVFQIATFTYKKVAQRSLFLKIFQDCRNEDDSFSIKGLVCGNMFATGEHGFSHSSVISKQAALEIMARAAQHIKKNSRWEDLFSVILFKEFWPTSLPETTVLEDLKYRSFQADVNMVLAMDPSWKTFADYLKNMKAKYRTKANSAYKKSEALSIRSLTSVEIAQHQNSLQQLFTNVLKKSDYRYGENYPASFVVLKENLGDLFICKGVFLDGKMIAFSTAFVNGDNLEANYVGIDYQYNIEYAVYERLLYDYVEEAIRLQVSQLHLGRTSELIKSALGALPVELTLYARHKSKIKNVLLRPVLENIAPGSFEMRKPFSNNLD